jgi:hypothetical protein
MNFSRINLQVKLASMPYFLKSKSTGPVLEQIKSLRLVVCLVRELNFYVDTFVDPK